MIFYLIEFDIVGPSRYVQHVKEVAPVQEGEPLKREDDLIKRSAAVGVQVKGPQRSPNVP
jgi:hypothetical protein